MKYLIIVCILLNYLIPVESFAESANIRGEYTKEQVHGVKQDCLICHVSHDMKGMILLKASITGLCLKCHPDRKTPAEHVVDVVPSMKTGELPITDGKMTCVTCHDSHKYPYEKMLRVNPKDLCQGCHRY